MDIARMAVLSLMVGFVAAGLVWFGWDLIENLRAKQARVRSPRQTAPAKPRAERGGQAEGKPEGQGDTIGPAV